MTDDKKTKKKSGGWMYLLVWLVLIPAGTIALPTTILLMVGLLPLIVSWLTDSSPQKNLAFCVGGFNVIGVFPFVIQLWQNGHGINDTAVILSNVFNWLAMYGAAAIGAMIHTLVPFLVVGFVNLKHEALMDSLRQIQHNLRKEWGDEVKISPISHNQSENDD